MDSIIHGIRSGTKGCLYRNVKLGGVMEKLKDMWSNMSKKGKMFLGALVVILLIIIYNYVF